MICELLGVPGDYSGESTQRMLGNDLDVCLRNARRVIEWLEKKDDK